MGLPNNLGRLSPAITSDASLNIGIGVTPSGSFKFEVGTTSKFTGVATFGSTLSNGTYSYTLPGATGTLALVGGAGVGTVTSVAALTLGTTGTDLSSTVANSTTTPVITLNVPTASASNRGALSAADWTTFNNKQNLLTNPVTGTGTTNYLPKFTAASTIGNSAITDDGTTVTLISRALSGTSATFSGNVTLGTIGGGTSTASPSTINLTSTFSSTAGSNLKLKLFEDTGGNIYGIGVSNGQMDFNLAIGGTYRFYTGAAIFSSTVTALGFYDTVYSAGWVGNNVSSYTQWKTVGSKGTYSGFYDTLSAVTPVMYDASGNGGTYHESTGTWYTYFQRANACMGINGSATSSSYSLQVNGGKGINVVAGTNNFGGTVTAPTFVGALTGNAGSVTYLPNRTDVAAYQVLWGAPYTNGIGTIAYSCAAITIQSSTGTLQATNLYATSLVTAQTNGDYRQATLGAITGAALFIRPASSGSYGLLVGSSYTYGDVWLQASRTDGIISAYNISLNASGGTVTVGTVAPQSGCNLTVSGAAYFSGTVTAPTFVGALTGNASTATNFNNGYAYSSGSTVYVDTLESINSADWLELVYYGGLGVRIGTGVNGSKALYAGSLYDSGNRVYSAANPQVNISGNAATATTASNTNSISSAVGGSYTWTNTNYFRSNQNTTGSSPPLQAYSDSGLGAIMSFHRGGYYAVNMGLDSDNVFRIGGWSAPANLLQLDMSGNLTLAATINATTYYQPNTSFYFTSNSGSYGAWYIGGQKSGYSGFRVDGDMQLMLNGGGASGPCGFYHASVGWSILTYVNASQYLYNNGSEKFSTTGDGAYVSGNLYVTGNVYANYSDIRLKKDVEVIKGAISKIKQLRGVTYTWNDEQVNILKERAGIRDIGLIAQEVQSIEPLLTEEYKTRLNTPSKDPKEAANFISEESEAYMTVKYEKLVALLVEGIKEQQLQIEELKQSINNLSN